MSTMQVQPAAFSIRWSHPTGGTVQEWVCREHQQRVLGALHILGMSFVSEVYDARDRGCARCLAAAHSQTVREHLNLTD